MKFSIVLYFSDPFRIWLWINFSHLLPVFLIYSSFIDSRIPWYVLNIEFLLLSDTECFFILMLIFKTCWIEMELFCNHISCNQLFAFIICACVCAQSLSHIWLFATPRTIAHRTPLSRDFPGEDTGVGCHFLLQQNFRTQAWNQCLLHWRQVCTSLSHKEMLYNMHFLQIVLEDTSHLIVYIYCPICGFSWYL